MGTSIDNFKGEGLIIKEEGDKNSDDVGVQSYLWDRWVMDVYPLVLLQKAKRFFKGLRVLCLRWWNGKVIPGTFKRIEDKYGGFNRTHEGANLGRGWTTRRKRESRRGRNGN